MRVLLDERVHVGVKAAFSGHVVKLSLRPVGAAVKDGLLLAYAQVET